MKARLDCFSCFLRIGLQAARMAKATEAQERALMKRFLEVLSDATEAESPLAVAYRLQQLVAEETGVADPYQNLKDKCNAEAAQWLPRLRVAVARAPDPLHAALKVATIGNIMDYGAFSSFDAGALVERLHRSDFTVNEGIAFRRRLTQARTLAYLVDNTGEILFDSVLIAHLLEHASIERIRLVIRETPFLNDVSSAAHVPAELRAHPRVDILQLSVVPSARDPQTWQAIVGSDLVLCKGMANFENYGSEPDFFCLLIAKCALVANLITERTGTEVHPGDWILLHNV